MSHQHSENQAPVAGMDHAFRGYRQFNDPQRRAAARGRWTLDSKADRYFSGDNLPDRLARALGEARVIRVKELLESFEMFERVRRRLRAPEMADICCGHGLVGLLFAIFEPEVKRVTLIDRKKPAYFQPMYDVLLAQAPWMGEKVRYVEEPMRKAAEILNPGTAILGVHACGQRTDRCLDLAVNLSGKVEVMPCCYSRTGEDAPRTVRKHIGVIDTTDIHRTYRLERAGYQVEWLAIPGEITPMNRIILALPGS